MYDVSPSLRDSCFVGCSTPSSARASLHSGLLSAVPPGLVSWLGAQPRVPLVARCTRGYCLPSRRDSSRGWVLNPEFRSWLAALGGYCLPSLRDSSRGRVPNPEFRSWLAALGATVCRPSGTRLVVGCSTPSSARGSLHSGLLAAVPPGLLFCRVLNPEFRSWLAALGATVCRPSGTRLVVGCSTPSSARGSLHSGLLAAVPPGLLFCRVLNPEFRSWLAALGATVCRPSGTRLWRSSGLARSHFN